MPEENHLTPHISNLPFHSENSPERADLILARLDDPNYPYQNPNISPKEALEQIHEILKPVLDPYAVDIVTKVLGEPLLEAPFPPHILQSAVAITLKDQENATSEQAAIQKFSLEIVSKILAQVAFFPIYDSGHAEQNMGYMPPEAPAGLYDKLDEEPESERGLGKRLWESIRREKQKISLQDLERMSRYARCMLQFFASRQQEGRQLMGQVTEADIPSLGPAGLVLFASQAQSEAILPVFVERVKKADALVQAARKIHTVNQATVTTLQQVKVQLTAEPPSEEEQSAAVLKTLSKKFPAEGLFSGDLTSNILTLFRAYGECVGRVKDPEAVFNAWINSLPKIGYSSPMNPKIANTAYFSLSIERLTKKNLEITLFRKIDVTKNDNTRNSKKESFPFTLKLPELLNEFLLKENINVHYKQPHFYDMCPVFKEDETWDFFDAHAHPEERKKLEHYIELERAIPEGKADDQKLQESNDEVLALKRTIDIERENFEAVRERWRMFDQNSRIIAGEGNESEKENLSETRRMLNDIVTNNPCKRVTTANEQNVSESYGTLEETVALIRQELKNREALDLRQSKMHQAAKFIDTHGDEGTEKPKALGLIQRINAAQKMRRVSGKMAAAIAKNQEQLNNIKHAIEAEQQKFRVFQKEYLAQQDLFKEVKANATSAETASILTPSFSFLERALEAPTQRVSMDDERQCLEHIGQVQALQVKIQQEQQFYKQVQERCSQAKNKLKPKSKEAIIVEFRKLADGLLSRPKKRVSNEEHDSFQQQLKSILEALAPKPLAIRAKETALEIGGIVFEIKDAREISDFVRNKENLKEANISPESFEDHGKELERIPGFSLEPGTYMVVPRVIAESWNQTFRGQHKVVQDMPKRLEKLDGQYIIPDINLLLYFVLKEKKSFDQAFNGNMICLRSETMVPDTPHYRGDNSDLNPEFEDDDNIVGEHYEIVFNDPELDKGEIAISSGDPDDTTEKNGTGAGKGAVILEVFKVEEPGDQKDRRIKFFPI